MNELKSSEAVTVQLPAPQQCEHRVIIALLAVIAPVALMLGIVNLSSFGRDDRPQAAPATVTETITHPAALPTPKVRQVTLPETPASLPSLSASSIATSSAPTTTTDTAPAESSLAPSSAPPSTTVVVGSTTEEPSTAALPTFKPQPQP